MATLVETELLSQCTKLLHDVISVNPRVCMNIQIGSFFTFSFSSHDKTEGTKRLSPSQLRRNESRKINFRDLKKELIVYDEIKSADRIDVQTQAVTPISDKEVSTDDFVVEK